MLAVSWLSNLAAPSEPQTADRLSDLDKARVAEALDQGNSRFYCTGMAQAFLLDRLAPGCKTRAFDDGVWLDDLLAEAVE